MSGEWLGDPRAREGDDGWGRVSGQDAAGWHDLHERKGRKMIDYQKLYMDQLRYCDELSAKVAELADACAVARQQAKNATIRTVAMEKRIAELERRIQGLESR